MPALNANHFMSASRYEMYMTRYNEAKKYNHPAFIDDAIPVHPELLKFFLEFRHKVKDAVPSLNNTKTIVQSSAESSAYAVYVGFDVVFADAPDMRCGHMRVTWDKVGGKAQYVVTSPSIKNERYNMTSDGYHIKSTTNFKTAVKTARQHIKPFSFHAVLTEHDGALRAARQRIIGPARSRLREILSFSEIELFDEMRSMREHGYKPKQPTLLKAFNALEHEGDELLATSQYNPQHAFVWFVGDKAKYQIIGNDAVVTASTPEELPEDIRNKLAVLQIGAAYSPVKDVGVKVDDTKYWVFL